MILVFGQTGQVARELARFDGMHCLSRAEADLSVPGACAAAIEAAAPDAVINAAAFTAVDRAEAEEDAALRINGEAPGEMARACAGRGIPMVQISTDYVFDGSGDTPRRPDEPTSPVNAYGRTKHAGELAVIAAGGVHVVLRTSWVFSAHGANFVKTMRRLGAERDSLNVVADQIGGPTPAAAIARACRDLSHMLRNGAPSGVHHFAGTPDVCWADFARAIMAEAGRDCTIHDIATADYPTPAPRPLNSRLDCTALTATFGIARPDWRDALPRV